MFSEIQYNKIQIYVIKIFEMTHPHFAIFFESMWRIKNVAFRQIENY